jgi:uncharacterized protein (DUF2461 family)
VFRLAQGEFKAFVEALTDVLVRTDAQLPPLPPKDVIHRIHRDLRCSNDKTPYKPVFGASFSRSGRNGIFAGCAWRHGVFSRHALMRVQIICAQAMRRGGLFADAERRRLA